MGWVQEFNVWVNCFGHDESYYTNAVLLLVRTKTPLCGAEVSLARGGSARSVVQSRRDCFSKCFFGELRSDFGGMSVRGPWSLGNLNLDDYFPQESQAFEVNS